MPLLTYNIELASKPDRTGRSSVMVRLHMKGQKPARILTSVKIVEAHKSWNPKKTWGKWVLKDRRKEDLNTEIENEYLRIKKRVELWQKEEPDSILTPAILADRFKSGSSERYFVWLDAVLEDVKRSAYSTYVNKKSAVNIFREWAGDDLPLQSVTPMLARDFQRYLITTDSEKTGDKRKASSINVIIIKLHKMHQDILVKSGKSPRKAALLSPWGDVKKLTEVKSQKSKLSEKAIQDISKVSVTARRKRVSVDDAFRVWLLSHFLAGMRFADVMQLRYRSFTTDADGQPVHLKYEMLKTGNVVSIPLFESAIKLLKHYWNPQAKATDYILPWLDNKAGYAKLLTYEQYRSASFEVKKALYNAISPLNVSINRSLKKIESESNLNGKLRMHNARHSFAALAKQIMKDDKSITMIDIQSMMGHSSYKTTEIYTNDFDETQSIQPMQAIFNRKKGLIR
ncbi:site-specific integrase [Spirosoma humi]